MHENANSWHFSEKQTHNSPNLVRPSTIIGTLHNHMEIRGHLDNIFTLVHFAQL